MYKSNNNWLIDRNDILMEENLAYGVLLIIESVVAISHIQCRVHTFNQFGTLFKFVY
jgi:hypothetical protein